MTSTSPRDASTNPLLPRVLPFLIFVGLTACQGKLGPASRFWIYLCKTLVGAVMVWMVHRSVREMRWKLSWEAVGAGVLVFAIWVGLDGFYPASEVLFKKLLCPLLGPIGLNGWCSAAPAPVTPWNPYEQFGWWGATGFAIVRLLGSSVVVPPIEEIFYRSFLYRYIIEVDFEKVPLSRFCWKAFLITSLVFGFVHVEWIPGILCAMVYQALVIWRNRLGDAIVAHSITNFLLGLWVIGKGAWHFW